MKILQIISSMQPENGGMCQGIRNTIPELQKLGITNDVICLDNPNSDYLGKDCFPIYALGEAKTAWKYNKDLLSWLNINFKNYDKIIVHGLWSYHSYAAIKVFIEFKKARKETPNLYVMPHGMLDPYFQKAESRKLKALRNDFYWKFFEKNVINSADGVLFTCEEELLLAKTTFPNYLPKQELNVGYGIQSPPNFKPTMRETFASKVPNWNGKPFLLFLSRIHTKKGVDLLIEAYLQLEHEIESIPQLIIAGPGREESYGIAMQKLASKSKNILFPGMLSGDAKWGAFYTSEVFVLPSHQENFGIAVVEALACSKPVLISNKVNIWREIKNGNGGIVKEDTGKETYDLLKKWFQLSVSEKDKMSQNAENVFSKHYTIKQAAKKLHDSIS
ncbi:glycosyltransferase [Maribacter sp. BPC-D8]|uniref:glycosyltransferase n=1 Tax=Maribacter sp. BPC-D8 TaxID=3053613 RepID=UPI002B4A2D02|nr:glycosyltransferase [Maribacter sp. BPC-D8]WRI28323.1 glycosyltransferase [Maribacter sp. BPC-D8]